MDNFIAQYEKQIIGPVNGLDGLILATGFSGHGFALGPGIGSLLAQLITTGSMSDMMKPFSLERFNGKVPAS